MKIRQNNKIAVMGYLCLDLFPDLSGSDGLEFVPGMLKEIGSCAALPGGVVGNTGVALHRLGIPVKLAGRVGNDVFGHSIRDYFRRLSPAYMEHITVDDNGHTGYCIVLSPRGSDRMFLAYRGINDTLAMADAGNGFLDDSMLLHFGYPPLCMGFAVDHGRELRNLFTYAHDNDVITSLDMSLPAAGTFSYELDWMEFMRNVLPATDIFLPSIDELRFMLKPQQGGRHLETLRTMAEQLLGLGAAVVAIKLGSDGLYVRTTGDFRRLQRLAETGIDLAVWLDRELLAPCYQVEVAGTTGAGDATIAGFLAGVTSGATVEQAALLAVGTGAFSVSAHDSVSGIRPLAETRNMITAGWKQRSISFDTGNIQISGGNF
jgi:sugar/nucleoside kinase (ribokinase family)